jgi:dolichol kinase
MDLNTVPVEAGVIITSPSKATEPQQIAFSSEIIRKLIHLCSLSIPVVYFYVTRETALWILIPIGVFSVIVDLGRHHIKGIENVVGKIFDPILRPHERKSGLLSGATYVVISALFCVLFFPKLITITAFSILIVSDASSALIGRAYGKHKFFDKSLEGSAAFVITACLVVLITPKAGPVWQEYAIAGFAAVLGAIAEAASARTRLDDNFSVPISIGFSMWGLYYLLSIWQPERFSKLYQLMLRFS